MKVIALNLETGEEIIFKYQKDAAAHAKEREKIFNALLNDNPVYNGWEYKKIEPTEEELAIRAKNNERKRKWLRQTNGSTYGITEFARSQFKIFKYERNAAFVCVTPCPYYGSPKPTIGSTRCQQCASFRGIDRKTSEVACSRTTYMIR